MLFYPRTNEHNLFHSYRECRTLISWISLLWRSLEETTWNGCKMWSFTWLPRSCELPLNRIMKQKNLIKSQLWSSFEDICLTHSRRNTSLKRISGLSGSLLRSVLTIRRWSTCLKQGMIGKNSIVRTLSPWMSLILKFAESCGGDFFSQTDGRSKDWSCQKHRHLQVKSTSVVSAEDLRAWE